MDLDNTVVLDALPSNITYVPGSTKVNGVAVPDNTTPATPFSLDESGYVLTSIPPGAYSDVKYRVTVNAGATTILNTVTIIGGSIHVGVTATTNVPVTPPSGSTQGVLVFTDTTGNPMPISTPNSGLYLTLTDADSQGTGTQTVVVRNLTTGDIETITLTETGPNTGVFRNTAPLPSSVTAGLPQGDGTLYSPVASSLHATHTDLVFGGVCTATSTISSPTLRTYP